MTRVYKPPKKIVYSRPLDKSQIVGIIAKKTTSFNLMSNTIVRPRAWPWPMPIFIWEIGRTGSSMKGGGGHRQCACPGFCPGTSTLTTSSVVVRQCGRFERLYGHLGWQALLFKLHRERIKFLDLTIFVATLGQNCIENRRWLIVYYM